MISQTVMVQFIGERSNACHLYMYAPLCIVHKFERSAHCSILGNDGPNYEVKNPCFLAYVLPDSAVHTNLHSFQILFCHLLLGPPLGHVWAIRRGTSWEAYCMLARLHSASLPWSRLSPHLPTALSQPLERCALPAGFGW